MRRTWNIVVSLMLVFACGLLATAESADHKERPVIHTVLPKDAISAILKPEFVPATEAEVADDATMIGVVLGGDARAYSAMLLNTHEIVNDTIARKPVATTW
jgi:hypothetical protein